MAPPWRRLRTKAGTPSDAWHSFVSRRLVRSTYLIDEQGIIVRAFGKVKAKDNARQMLDELG